MTSLHLHSRGRLAFSPHTVSPLLRGLILQEPTRKLAILDIGTGSGNLALSLAPHARRVVGIDADPRALALARARARKMRRANVRFVEADAETIAYTRWHPGMVVANFCMSRGIIQRAGRALPPGHTLVFACLHSDRYRELHVVPQRFSYHEDEIHRWLRQAGLRLEHLSVHRETHPLRTLAQARRFLGPHGVERWQKTGRWEKMERYIQRGGGPVTESWLVAKARKE
ncbi:MAG: class I SAM-dependent methyltransferase [Euryarchaeota archaeon]|nr:class I SAM-dependent methyltransferase [Euryarchaeota archaeon]